jgi:hypothetical protein
MQDNLLDAFAFRSQGSGACPPYSVRHTGALRSTFTERSPARLLMDRVSLSLTTSESGILAKQNFATYIRGVADYLRNFAT